MTFPCPCCGYLIFEEPPGSYDICKICFWEDDMVQLAYPDLDGGANHCSLIEGQANYAEFGACERKILSHVHPPGPEDQKDPLWRPLDLSRDNYLHWESGPDSDLWQSVKDPRDICLYYWKPEYWLKNGTT